MFVDDDGVRNRKALPTASSNFFGREEWLEDSFVKVGRDAVTRISNFDDCNVSISIGLYCNRSFRLRAKAYFIGDCVACIHNEIEKDLIEVPQVTSDGGGGRRMILRYLQHNGIRFEPRQACFGALPLGSRFSFRELRHAERIPSLLGLFSQFSRALHRLD